jgi:hypothetical protein
MPKYLERVLPGSDALVPSAGLPDVQHARQDLRDRLFGETVIAWKRALPYRIDIESGRSPARHLG